MGYSELKASSKLINSSLESGDGSVGSMVALVFDATPFYAESGGQVGDSGEIVFDNLRLEVIDTQKVQDGYFVHYAEVTEGKYSDSLKGKVAHLSVEEERRKRIRANHSATHIVHLALRKFLGDHVKQAGSRVSEDTLRFDYSHFEAVPHTKLLEIESFVNDYVRTNYEVITRVMPIDEAKKTGAVALFGEKYGDVVRVVQIGDQSVEFCGGTHVNRSGDIGLVTVLSEGGISAGIRRIECSAGPSAYEQLLLQRERLDKVSSLLKTDEKSLSDKVEKLLLRNKELERELSSLKGKMAQSSSGDIFNNARVSSQGFKVIAEKVPETDTDTLRTMVDRLRLRLGSGVVALAATQGESAVLVAGVTSDLLQKVNAGSLVKEAAKLAGGRGGGRADFAQAGGLDIEKIPQSLEKIFELVK